jgi:hypothetical protein
VALFRLDRPDARDPRARPDATISEYLGIRTNNVAEYVGVVRAVTLAAELGAERVEPPRLEPHRRAAPRSLAVKDAKPAAGADALRIPGLPGGWVAAHVPRAQNSLADALPTPRSIGRRRRSAGGRDRLAEAGNAIGDRSVTGP